MIRMQNSTLLVQLTPKQQNSFGDVHLLSRLMLLLLCVSLTACNGNNAAPESPVAKPSITIVPTESQVATVEPGFITSPVFVDKVEIQILESFPVQVHIKVIGNLATPCSEISHTEQEMDLDNFIMFTIFSKQEADTACVQVLEPFEEFFALDVSGLPAGIYQVSVNGIEGEFVLTVDNGALD